MSEDLQAAIQRVIEGSRDEADLEVIADAVVSERLVLANAPQAVGIGGNVTASQVVPGTGNVVGDGNVVFQIEKATAQVLQAIPALKTIWSQHLDFEQSESSTSIDEIVQQVRFHCCERIQHLYSKIRLLNRKQIEVDRLYVDVYILEKLTNATYANIQILLNLYHVENERLGLGKRKKRLPGFETANKHDKLMILGKPGSGKSTFLRHLAIACCKKEFQPELIPILIELRAILDFNQFDLITLLHQGFELTDEAQTQQILKDGKVLLLLDGLDEVNEQTRRAVQSEIQKFSNHYYKNRIILTCRTQVAENILDQFEYVEVADFNWEQIAQFAHNWFVVLAESPEQGTALAADFIRNLQQTENKPTAELAITPVLLSLACWVFQDLQDFPRRRVDLYRRGIELLLEQWDEGRGIRRESKNFTYRQLSIQDKHILLGKLAIRKLGTNQFILFEQDEIQAYITEHLKTSHAESREVLRSIEAQHGLLIERASQIYSFSHLTFQEYFASYLVALNCNLHTADSSSLQELVDHMDDKHWREVFLLTTNLLNDANPLLQQMKIDIDKMLSKDKKLQHFLKWANKKASLVQASCHPAAARVFYIAISLKQAHSNLMDLDSALGLDLEAAKLLVAPATKIMIENEDIILAIENVSSSFASKILEEVKISKSFHSFMYSINTSTESALHAVEGIAELVNYLIDEPLRSRDIVRSLVELPLIEALIDNKSNAEVNFYAQLEAWLKKNLDSFVDWNLSYKQKELLKKYLRLNKLLLECLNSHCNVSLKVKNKIEKTLLMSVSDIDELQ